MRSLSLPLTCLALAIPVALIAASACSDDGVTTSCEEMVVTEYDDNGDPVNSDEVRAWWNRALADGQRCATAPSGEAGAPPEQ